MLRTALCVLSVSSILALGVDDTEKRRSEEILRAVAAAATADYEGLQHMKFQKSATRTKIMETTETKVCVSALLKALIEEKTALQKSIELNVTQNLNSIEEDVEDKRNALKLAINQAIVKVYEEIKRRYTELQSHSINMKAALVAEMNVRTNDINGQNSPEKLFEAIMKHAAKQLNTDDNKELDKNTVQQHLAEMMLADARKNALSTQESSGVCTKTALGITSGAPCHMANDLGRTACLNNNDAAGIYCEWDAAGPDAETDADYIRIENILLAAGVISQNVNATPINIYDPSERDSPYNSVFVGLPGSDGITSGRINNASNHGTTLTDWSLHMTKLEEDNLKKLEAEFIQWTLAKSKYHNVSSEKSAYDAAAAMVEMKIRAVEGSKDNINSYATELEGLEDDEMRKIADIKDEFESLAADWLQLATYHCCDIVQGNAIECTDATNHLIEPINSVFPHALKKPDVATDCTRRLL